MGAVTMALEHSWHELAVATDAAGDNGNGSPGLKERIWFTLGILLVYRLGTFVPIPGVDPWVLDELFWFPVRGHGAFAIFNMFGGGALGRMSIFALSVMPYLLAMILMQFLASVSPRLKALWRQGAAGHRKMRRYICSTTVLLCVIQSYGLAVGLESMTYMMDFVVYDSGLVFRLTTVATLTAGTMLLVWLAEQITGRGIGNGIALIVFAGVVANLPLALAGMLELGRTGALSGTFIIVVLVLALAVMTFIVFMENAERKVVINYPKRQSSTGIFRGHSPHLFLKLNVSGIAAPIFASLLLVVPLTVATFPSGSVRGEWLGEITQMVFGWPVRWVIYAGLIVFFAVFCAKTVFNPTDIAESLKERGGFVPGIRPGKNTAEHLNFIQTRLSAFGAAYLALVCLIPDLGILYFALPYHFGGTSLFVIVLVAVEITRQIRAELLASAR